jgi:4-hydroxy-3-methylbut-2-enyl diphosphate reductase
MKVFLAKQAGYCFGVRRAVELAEKTLTEARQQPEPAAVYSLGALIHNPQAVARLEEKGLRTVDAVDSVPTESWLIIRSHGAPREVLEQARAKKIKIIDTTCPFVRNAQAAAEDFHQAGRQVVIFGDAKHAEVIGINSRAEYSAIIVQSAKEVNEVELPERSKVGLVCQTTQKTEILKEVVDSLLEKTKDLAIKNTICNDCFMKQEEVRKMARKVKAMVIVGGKESSNTAKLFQIAHEANVSAYHIEEAAELQREWFSDKQTVGVAAGASTPDFSIEAVVKKLQSF